MRLAWFPAHAHLERDGDGHGADGGGEQAGGAGFVAHEGGAGHLADGDLLHGAAEVDVDQVRAAVDRDTGSLGHGVRVAAGKLHGVRAAAGIDLRHALGIAIFAHDRPACDHLGHDQPGTEFPGQAAERQVGDARHRREDHRRLDAHGARAGFEHDGRQVAHDLSKLRRWPCSRNWHVWRLTRLSPDRIAPAMRIAALLVAAGSGSRFGAPVPKQFALLAGLPVIRHAARALLPHVELLLLVGDAALVGPALDGIEHLEIVAGGATRQDSVRRGLEALEAHAPDIVLVHDAARPFLPEETVPALLAALTSHRGAIPAVPVADTLKRVAGGSIVATVARDGLFRAQTPQAFWFRSLLALHREHPGGATDDAGLLEAAGHGVAVVPGHEDNIKLTYPEDLVRLERAMMGTLAPRVGTGFDVHRMEAGRPMVLCGVTVPHEQGLAGHSDGGRGHPCAVRRDLWRVGGGRHRAALPAQ